MAATMAFTLLNSTEDPCQSHMLPIPTYHPEASNATTHTNIILCNYTLGNYSHITNISLKSLSFQGSLPPQLVNLKFLRFIDFTRNYLNGTLPKEWASLQHLDTIEFNPLQLGYCQPLNGGNSTGLGQSYQSYSLVHFRNSIYLLFLCKCIAIQMCPFFLFILMVLIKTKSRSLEANQLSGSIPGELGKLVKLNVLALSCNQFVGSLPKTLANIKNMNSFRISDNNFSGPVPELLGKWTHLTRLEMYSSGFEGPIPDAIFHLENLTDLRISDMSGLQNFGFPNLSKKINHLYAKYFILIMVLRNLNMSGQLPTNIGHIGYTLDLTFNNLEGEINIDAVPAHYTFLGGNKFTGNIPDSFLLSGRFVDLSYNNFTPLTGGCPDNRRINLYQSFSQKNKNSMAAIKAFYNRLKLDALLFLANDDAINGFIIHVADYRSLHINCGGPDMIINNTLYEGDRNAGFGAAWNYNHGTNWGFISTGDFMDDNETNSNGYIISTNSTPLNFSGLYSTARASPLYLIYYGYCLVNGNYTVNLHFAEILFGDAEPYNRVGRRIFNIYIQGSLVQKDFNIKEAANGTGKEIIRSFNTTVTDNTLEIRLYWTGKGTTCIPRRGCYGAIISAISVCYGFKSNCVDEIYGESKKTRNLPVVVGIVTSVLSLIFITMGFFYWRCYTSGHKNTTERDLEGLDLQTCTFTFRQLRAATKNFDSENKIGEGGFGSVYKAFDLQQKGNLMELVDPKLENEFNKEEAERMIKVALLCSNASPSLRPTMSEVVSMLDAETDIQEVISDPSIYGSDLQLQPLKNHYQRIQDQSSRGSSAQNFSSDKASLGSSTTSAHDLFSINSESIRELTSTHDLYPLNSQSTSLNVSDTSCILHHCS
ncbi:hypothetical protein Patl1_10408 [Pistacia atlantica]|uniref:Uncharacterized protein n=1 Tax=Pistacia atlantica TaxID=434234 RepID=A0ACC1A3C1_9ROSI|nr:hypothetical protein Patl1_10408 [Pistacia atlantica]